MEEAQRTIDSMTTEELKQWSQSTLYGDGPSGGFVIHAPQGTEYSAWCAKWADPMGQVWDVDGQLVERFAVGVPIEKMVTAFKQHYPTRVPVFKIAFVNPREQLQQPIL